MNMNKLAYTALVAFISMVFTLVATAWLGDGDANAQPTVAPTLRDIDMAELGRHATRDSCWKAIDGKVYDVTEYLPRHPSSEEAFVAWCGKLADEGWLNKRPGRPHSAAAVAMLQDYLIGRLVTDAPKPAPRVAPAGAGPAEESVRAAEAAVDGRPSGRILLGLAPGTYLDGRYRGVFSDQGEIQVTIQFDLRDGRLYNVGYRSLAYRDIDYLKLTEEDDLYPVLVQHRQITETLEGAALEEIFGLYEPGNMVADVDGFTGASLRGNKLISAIRDGLNRGVYQWR